MAVVALASSGCQSETPKSKPKSIVISKKASASSKAKSPKAKGPVAFPGPG
jgi:hypothetical protein